MCTSCQSLKKRYERFLSARAVLTAPSDRRHGQTAAVLNARSVQKTPLQDSTQYLKAMRRERNLDRRKFTLRIDAHASCVACPLQTVCLIVWISKCSAPRDQLPAVATGLAPSTHAPSMARRLRCLGALSASPVHLSPIAGPLRPASAAGPDMCAGS